MTVLKPEERAREWINRKLEDAGWKVINRDEFAPGMTAVAIREAMMEGGLEADYLLMLNGKAAGVLEAKREEIRLDDPKLIVQAERYTEKLPGWVSALERPLPLIYLSNGKEIAFRDRREADHGYKLIKKFPRPKDLNKRLGFGDFSGLPYLSPKGLRDCQFEAITNLEASFKAGKRRALMVLATGAGKTFTAAMTTYRMLAYTPIRRVLFLVDRNNLGVAAQTELKSFSLTADGKPMGESFGVERLSGRPIDSRCRVIVGTIQLLYAKLRGVDAPISEEEEDAGLGHELGDQVELPENPALPPDFFDLIIIDDVSPLHLQRLAEGSHILLVGEARRSHGDAHPGDARVLRQQQGRRLLVRKVRPGRRERRLPHLSHQDAAHGRRRPYRRRRQDGRERPGRPLPAGADGGV